VLANEVKKKGHILIVDDHSVVREGLKLLIDHEEDLEVSALAGDAIEAIAKVEDGGIDLAIVDISLNGQSGLKLTEDIKKLNPDLPVLILTMHDEELYAKRAFRAGAKGFVTKNEATDTVISAIRMMLKGHDYISDYMAQKFLRKIHGKANQA
jgi:DNA-binding NarL/FixJ family response regulator